MAFSARIQLAVPIFIVVCAAAVVWFGSPRPPQLDHHASGDQALAGSLRAFTGQSGQSGHQSVAATVITPDAITHAAIGESAPGNGRPIGPNDPIELGSITKTFNGFLLADAVTRGEAQLEDPLSKHLPELRDTPLGSVTLLELASHRGGVPPLPPGLVGKALVSIFSGVHFAGDATRAGVLAEAGRMQPIEGRGTVQYSNLGAALLGCALADAAGAPDWQTLVEQRLLIPHNIDAVFAATLEQIPPGTVQGYTSAGLRPEHSTGEAFIPAGSSTFISPAAISAYAQAILRGQIPDTAMQPLFDAGYGDRIGLAWFTSTIEEGRDLTWHNGGTGGFRTILIIDRVQQRAVFVVGNTDTFVDGLGFALLTGEHDRPPFNPMELIVPGLIALFVLLFVWSAVRSRNRLAVISSGASAVAVLAVARVLSTWAVVPAWIWAASVAVAAIGALLATRRWPTLSLQPRRFRFVRWVGASLNLLITGVAIFVTAGFGT